METDCPPKAESGPGVLVSAGISDIVETGKLKRKLVGQMIQYNIYWYEILFFLRKRTSLTFVFPVNDNKHWVEKSQIISVLLKQRVCFSTLQLPRRPDAPLQPMTAEWSVIYTGFCFGNIYVAWIVTSHRLCYIGHRFFARKAFPHSFQQTLPYVQHLPMKC